MPVSKRDLIDAFPNSDLTFLLAVLFSSGYASFPDLDALCRTMTTQSDCVATYALEKDPFYALSCIWVYDTPSSLEEESYVETRVGGLVAVFPATISKFCSTKFTFTLDKTAVGRYALFANVLSGPQVIKDYYPYFFEAQTIFSAATCITASTCNTTTTFPENYSAVAPFNAMVVTQDFMFKDSKLIAMLRNNSTLDKESTIRFRIQASKTRCNTLPEYPPATPAISDEVKFGTSDFFDFKGVTADHYFLTTYKTYLVSNVTGVQYRVEVANSLEQNHQRTRMSTFMMKEGDYQIWAGAKKSGGLIPPPEQSALEGSTCRSFLCKMTVGNLRSSQQYRLFVSYPNLIFVGSEAFSEKAPLVNPRNYARQTVRVEIFANSWQFYTTPKQKSSAANDQGSLLAKMKVVPRPPPSL